MSIDYLIKGGIIIDGASPDSLPYKADIAVEGDCIQGIGHFSHIDAGKTINADGYVVCPGFIDAHAHSEFTLLADGRGEGKISQGVTTEINGNCGMSAAPLIGPAREQRENELNEIHIKERWRTFSDYFGILEKKKFAMNFMTLTGHGNLRASVAGYADRPLTGPESEEMAALLRTSMDEGSKGLSTGLIYPPGLYSGTSEIIELASHLKRYKGVYATHMRSEGDSLTESVEEVIRIARATGIHAHISHLKASGTKNWNKLDAVFDLIESAHQEGMAITCDRYPYIASSTDLDTVLPAWAFEGGRRKEMERLKFERKKLANEVRLIYPEASDWENVLISSVSRDKNRWMEGRNVADIAVAQDKPVTDSVFDLLLEEELNVGAIFFNMDEANLQSVLKKRYCSIGTDSAARSFDGITASGVPHPRGFGTFPRVIGRYVRDLGVLKLGDAVHKMTGFPAGIFGLERRGILKEGFFADITIFDPDRIADRADFRRPFQGPEGLHHVFNNGVPVVLSGEPTGALPGRILR